MENADRIGERRGVGFHARIVGIDRMGMKFG